MVEQGGFFFFFLYFEQTAPHGPTERAWPRFCTICPGGVADPVSAEAGVFCILHGDLTQAKLNRLGRDGDGRIFFWFFVFCTNRPHRAIGVRVASRFPNFTGGGCRSSFRAIRGFLRKLEVTLVC